MKMELGLSVLSGTKTLLGIEIGKSTGIGIRDGKLVEDGIVTVRLGFVFFWIEWRIVNEAKSVSIPEDILEGFEQVRKQIKASKAEILNKKNSASNDTKE